jgi:hypothetical protein
MPATLQLNHFALEMALHGPRCAPCANGGAALVSFLTRSDGRQPVTARVGMLE